MPADEITEVADTVRRAPRPGAGSRLSGRGAACVGRASRRSLYARAGVDVGEHTGEIDGQPVFWRSAPSRPDRAPVLYVHGVPTSSDDWLPFLERTGGLAPDLLGFGRSGKGGQNDYSLEGIAHFIERYLDEVVEVERVRLVVHDWGWRRSRLRNGTPSGSSGSS